MTTFEEQLRRMEAKHDRELELLEARQKAEVRAFFKRARLMGKPQWVSEARSQA